MPKIAKVIIICSGNVARSPVAKFLAQFRAKQLDADLHFDSAGFFNAFGYMLPQSQAYLNIKKIKHSRFIPKVIDKKLLEKQDLIITMEKSHVIKIRETYPDIIDIGEKTFTLKEFNGENEDLDIIDPYYEDSKNYEKILNEIDENIINMVKKIIKLNTK